MHMPQAYKHTWPFYSITLTAVQRQPAPVPKLGIRAKREIWAEDGLDRLRRIVVGECLGQVQGHFMFPCWACEGVCDGAYDHHGCPYGIMKVEQALLHPLFNYATVPELPSFTYHINELWRDIPSERHLRLALVYPPGYQSDITTWYQYYPPIAIFTTEVEAQYAHKERLRRGFTTVDHEERMHLLQRESQEERRLAHRALRLAKLVAEACQAVYRERTYRRLLGEMNVRV